MQSEGKGRDGARTGSPPIAMQVSGNAPAARRVDALGGDARPVLVQDFRQYAVPVIFAAGAGRAFNAQMAHQKACKLCGVLDLVLLEGRKLLWDGAILLHVSHVAALSATPLSESRPGPEVLRPVVTDGLPLSRRERPEAAFRSPFI